MNFDFTMISYAITGFSAIYMFSLFFIRKNNFLKNSKPILAELKKYDSSLEKFGFDGNKILSNISEQYKRTFNSSKTERKSEEYFTVDRINTQDFNLGFFASYNNTLVGLGILFTFIGLTIGVTYFGININSAEAGQKSQAITEGIDVLLGGMGTAFLSSVLGMILSLSFSKMYKEQINSIDAGLSQVSNDLDSHFYKTSADFAEEKQEQLLSLMQNTLASSLITYKNESNKEVGLGTMTKELLTHSRRQADSLETFSNELADEIIKASNKNEENNGNLVKVLQDGFESLRQTTENPIKDLVDNLITELRSTFTQMSSDITSSIESVIKDIESKAGGQVIEQANEAANELTKITEHIALIPDRLKAVNEQTDKTATFTKDMIDKVNQTINGLQNVIELQSLAAEEIKGATEIYADKRSEMNTSLESIKITSRSLSSSVNKLDEEFEKYTTHTNQLEEKRTENITSVTSLVQSAEKMNSDLITNLTEVEVSVEKIFKQISEGLNGYHTQISSNTENEILIYSGAVIKITNSLHSIVDALNATLEDLDGRLGNR